jgi:hypothetical protein
MSNSSTAMRSALERAGIVPRHQPVDARFGERSAVQFVEPSQLSDKQLAAEFSDNKIQVAAITRQLDDDKEDGFQRGRIWRDSAKKARRAKQIRIDQLNQELLRREKAKREADQAVAAKERAAQKLAAAQAHQTAIETAAKAKLQRIETDAKARMEYARQSDVRNRTQCQMFVKAAYRLCARDEFQLIWNKAREMFPDHPAWQESPPHIEGSEGEKPSCSQN